jgi:hypothetical protein
MLKALSGWQVASRRKLQDFEIHEPARNVPSFLNFMAIQLGNNWLHPMNNITDFSPSAAIPPSAPLRVAGAAFRPSTILVHGSKSLNGKPTKLSHNLIPQ